MTIVGEPRWFLVFSPTYCEPIGYAIVGDPPEPRADVLVVEATSKRKAIQRAVAYWLKNGGCHVSGNIADGSPPWKGVKAESHHPLSDELRREYEEDRCLLPLEAA